ncbi:MULTISPECIES: tetratricopeptide repeat-containing diguanylate cyclase [unclassified Lysobacter]
MSKWVLPLAMLFATATAFAAPAYRPVAPISTATGESVETVLEDQRLHGYESPMRAIARLRAARARQGGRLSTDVDSRYWAAIAGLSLTGRDAESMRDALVAAEEISERGDCPGCRARLLVLRAGDAMQRLDYEVAGDLLVQAKPLVGSNPQLRLEMLRAKVRFQEMIGNLTASISGSFDALHLAQSLGNTADRVELLNRLARMNAILGNEVQALAFTEEALAIAESIGFVHAIAALHITRSHAYAKAGQGDKQLEALTKALAITQAHEGLSDAEVTILSNLADHYLKPGGYAQALAYASRAAALAVKTGNDNGLAVAMANQGIAMSGLGDVEAGVHTLEQSVALARRQGNIVYEIVISDELVRILEQAGHYKEALQAVHEAQAANDKLTLQEREKAVLELQVKYDQERKSSEIQRLSAQAELRKAAVAARNWRQRLWVVVAIASILAALLLVQRLRRTRHANRRLAVDNATLTEKSVRDELTGAFNRRHFHALMARVATSRNGALQEQGARSGIGLMLLDVDHFKTINDTHGHAAGDAVLVELTRRLQSGLREQDALVRWGGEEFVLVLSGVPAGGMVVLAQRILLAIAGEPVEVGSDAISVTASLGGVVFSGGSERQWQDALRLTDAAMYLAKHHGRNCAICLDVSQGSIESCDIDEICEDLAAAERAGKVELVTLLGDRQTPSSGLLSPLPVPAPGKLR